MSTTPATPKVGFVSLGCPKALVDSEQGLYVRCLDLFAAIGFALFLKRFKDTCP